MTSRNRNLNNAQWLRQLRTWGGILLMLFSLSGGYRSATTFVEEIETEPTTEFVEYDASPRLLNRRVRSDFAKFAALPDGVAPNWRAVPRVGSIDRSGHVLANGLRAPLRC